MHPILAAGLELELTISNAELYAILQMDFKKAQERPSPFLQNVKKKKRLLQLN